MASGFGALSAKGKIEQARTDISEMGPGALGDPEKRATLQKAVSSIIDSAAYIREYFREKEGTPEKGDASYREAVKPYEDDVRKAAEKVGMDPVKAIDAFRNPPMDPQARASVAVSLTTPKASPMQPLAASGNPVPEKLKNGDLSAFREGMRRDGQTLASNQQPPTHKP